MTRDDISAVLIHELGRMLPRSTQPRSIRMPTCAKSSTLISMDFLNLVTALGERLQIDIPEIDYPNLATLGQAVDYLAHRRGTAA